MPADAAWRLKNARVVKVTTLPRITFLRVQCYAGKYASFFDVKSFEPVEAREGDVLTLQGDLRMEKKSRDSNEYQLALFLTKVEVGDMGEAPSDERRRGRVVSKAPPPEPESSGEDDDLPF